MGEGTEGGVFNRWLRDERDFHRRVLDEPDEASGVLVNLARPTAETRAVSLGQALHWTLQGPTRSLTALVGYLHQGDVGDGDDGSHLEDPAHLIVAEAQEEGESLLQRADAVAHKDHTGFRLLTGQLNSTAAQLAFRTWYVLCRWRHETCEHEQRANALRARFIERAVKARSFAQAAQDILHSGSDLGGPFQAAHQPGAGQADDADTASSAPHPIADLVRGLQPLPGETRRNLGKLADALQEQLSKGGSAHDVHAANILLGFLLQRAADVRMDRSTDDSGGIFHPKIYVVERGLPQSDQDSHELSTVAFVGSTNWGLSAFGLHDSRRNTEVSTVHKAPGHLWPTAQDGQAAGSGASTQPGARGSLTAAIANTAHALFEAAPQIIGAWSASDEELSRVPPAAELLAITEAKRWTRDDHPPEEKEPGSEEGKARTPSPEFVALAPHLQRIIRRVLGLGEDKPYAKAVAALSEREASLFGGQKPAAYQVDGALRLLSILEGPGNGQAGSRGAFLTDEPGLGKTLISQMTAAILLAQRLTEHGGEADRRVRGCFVVPARLTGSGATKGGGNPTGWELRAREVREAVQHLLERVHGLPAPEAKRRLGRLELRVLSHGLFAPQALPDAAEQADLWRDPWADGTDKAPEFLDSFEFLASSEVVVIDESHNFRNQGSRGTRTLRFLLSLPVPGEAWGVKIAAPSTKDGPRDGTWVGMDPSQVASANARHRRVLNLSATPFNNRLEDLITQVGHFLQVQDWHAPYSKHETFVRETPLGLDRQPQRALIDVLHDALHAWYDPSTSNEDRSRALRVLVQLVRRHLHSGRSLTVPPDQAERKASEGRDDRTRYDDLGPEYTWSSGAGAQCEKAFAGALKLRRAQERAEQEAAEAGLDPSTAPITASLDDTADAVRRNLETELTRLFVQRSRIRALRIIEGASTPAPAHEGAARTSPDSETMFRKPHVPRHPLALNPGQNRARQGGSHTESSSNGEDGSNFESQVLTELLTGLLDPTADTGLTLFAYELSVRRRRTDEQSARNALGFQRIQLIKRLQSSPYAFLRTLVRGILRSSLAELALVERALEQDSPERVRLAAAAQAAGHSLEDIEDALTDMRGVIENKTVVDQVAALGEGHKPGAKARKDGKTFQVRCGWLDEKLKLAGGPSAARYEKNYQALKTALGDEPAASAVTPWHVALLEDIAKGPGGSRLFQDIQRVSGWIDVNLLTALYGELSDLQLEGQPLDLVGQPFDTVRDFALALLTQAEKTATPRNRRALLAWVLERLRSDHRACSLIAWLLLQTAPRTPTLSVSTGNADLPAGIRSLIFTEYTDTQDYVVAILAALTAVMASPGAAETDASARSKLAELRRLLWETVKQVGSDLIAQAQDVKQQTPAPGSFTDPGNFRAPVDPAWFHGLLEEAERNPAHLDAIVAELAAGFAWVSGKTTGANATGEGEARLRPPRLRPSDSNEAKAKVTVVDAFSPWYQIEPSLPQESTTNSSTHREQARELLSRLAQAAAAPVYALMATEVLAEGVNLQECGVVIHYDLPWNPTNLIQRNGRVDRRLNPTYEQSTLREGLKRKLYDLAAYDVDPALPDFQAPEQVFHLTVVPVEPDLTKAADHSGTADSEADVQNQVRRRLARKLYDIQTLFGLTSWPVVLDEDDARRVLSGELDFETPGFRRREELFAALRKLDGVIPGPSQSEDAQPSDTPPEATASRPGSLLLTVPAWLRARLAQRLVGAGPGTDPPPDTAQDESLPGAAGHDALQQAWRDIRAAGVVLWTPAKPVTRPVRSVTDATAADSQQQGAICGSLIRRRRPQSRPEAPTSADLTTSAAPKEAPKADPIDEALVWFYGSYDKEVFFRRWLGLPPSTTPGILVLPVAPVELPGVAEKKDARESAGEDDMHEGEIAPTELADEILLTVVDAGVSGLDFQVAQEDAAIPAGLFGPPALGSPHTDARAWLMNSWALARVHPEKGVPRGGFGPLNASRGLRKIGVSPPDHEQQTPAPPTDEPAPSTPNLWLRFQPTS